MLASQLIIFSAFLFGAVGELRGEATGEDFFTERVARWLSPELRRVEAQLSKIAGELKQLPELRQQPFASRYGFRSETLETQDEPQWTQIDLMRSETIDRIVAMPANIPVIGAKGAGYGFPLRFRIEVADNPEMTGAVTVADYTAADFENPGGYPVNFRLEEVKARYVRFTSTKHFAAEDGFMWALEELIVLSGNRTVAVGRPVTASSSLELYPNWAHPRLTDGSSALRMPVTTEESPSRGYLSAVAEIPDSRKWLAVDLGREFAIDEIHLLPVETANFQHPGLQSFPRGYKLELSRDPEFTDVTWSSVYPKTNLVGYPGGCAVVLQSDGQRGRYIRLETQSLWGEGSKVSYALSELQAYSGNENVALGKSVSVSDATDLPESSGWFPSALVDGFTSQSRIIEIPEYLDLIERRGILDREAELLVRKKERKVKRAGQALGYGGVSLTAVFALGWGSMLVRQRAIRERAVIQLREQISRDLHDDIGSNLGGIVLLSEMGGSHSEDEQSRADFQMIKAAADDASASMRDIVWLIQSGHVGLRDQVTKMRESAQMILGDKEVSLSIEPSEFRDRALSLLFRRHVLFSFKEVLNNIRKHATAKEVEILIRIDSTKLTFSIRDDGKGFDLRSSELPGHGLANLQRRAERLHGTCKIESSPDEGSCITFTAPLKS